MASVWKRLQRVNKRAAKFQYTASYHRIDLHAAGKWKPNKLSVVWTRRSRRVVTDPLDWEPSLKDPLKGSVIWPVPENQTVAITLFKDSRTNELEDKDWTFLLEDVSPTGKRRRLASSPLNMRRFASLEPTQHNVTLTLHPATQKIHAASLHLTVHCVLLREGQATDEDMQSLASLLSVNNNSDIAPLEDLDEDDYSLSDNSASIKQMLDLTQQLDQMTTSLTANDLTTPVSLQSLNFDNSRTPTAPPTPLSPHPHNDDSKTPTAPAPYLTILETNEARQPDGEPIDHKPTPEIQKPSELKGVVFRTKQFSKHNLKPLELKGNFNSPEGGAAEESTPVAAPERQPAPRDHRDKTPVQDLLEWCTEATREYRQCRVTNLTTSFRNGIALCAIVHRYRPDLIDFSALQPEDAETNVRIALEASAALGVSQVLTARDILRPGAPDRLAVMTHLFQLRAHFTGGELQVEQLGNNPQESSYMVGRHDTDSELPSSLFSLEIANRKPSQRASLSSQDSVDSQVSQCGAAAPGGGGSPLKASSPTGARDVRGLLLAQSKNILGKMLSPTKEKLATQKVERDSRLIKDAERERGNTRWFGDPLGASKVSGEVKQVKPIKLMTHKQLVDPFGSDDDDDEINPPLSPVSPKSESKPPSEDAARTPASPAPPGRESRSLSPPAAAADLPKPAPQLLSRHDELKERARQLLEATKREARERDGTRREKEEKRASEREPLNGVRNGDASPKKWEEARQAALRERARRLIADARAGVVSPTSPASPGRYPRAGTVEIISRQSMLDEIAAAGGVEQLDKLLARRDSAERRVAPPEESGENGNESAPPGSPAPAAPAAPAAASPLHSFSALIERLTPDKDAGDDDLIDHEGEESGSYIQSEMEALEREQSAIDEQAALLEKELRRVMETSNSTELSARLRRSLELRAVKEEDKLMSKWFTLVNKKNALLRRQMQLNILEQEEDLSRRCNLLARELRLSLAVEEWRKTPGQRRRERLLLQELLAAVNERDRLVHEMDSQERAIEDDDEIERNLSTVEIQRKNNCILQ